MMNFDFALFQLCSRGRVHVFKYLEIQAIKEDRKRGVLTDVEYRRSYRKTGNGQLNDFRYKFNFCRHSSLLIKEYEEARVEEHHFILFLLGLPTASTPMPAASGTPPTLVTAVNSRSTRDGRRNSLRR